MTRKGLISPLACLRCASSHLHRLWVVAVIAGTLLGCEKAQEPVAHLPAGPTTAARIEVPSAGSAPVAVLPISTAEACGEGSSISDATGQGGRSIPHLLRVVLSPSMAFAQGRTKIGKSNGDVHLQMLNGHRYDFQAVGEFIALKSESGSLEIQVRHQPYANSKWVSVATAVAMNVAGDQVGVYSGQPIPFRVNHQPVVLKEPVLKLRQGGRIERQGNGFVVIWPSKTQVRVLFGSYLDYIVTLCPSEQGRMAGLLGNPNADPEKGLTARDGASVQLAGLTREAAYKQLYRTFGDSWRIGQKGSLFDYEKGQSTQTFTDLNFPYEFDPAIRLTDAQRRDAEGICRKAGISDAAALADCILDVGITGDRAFADNNALVETMYVKSRRAQAGVGSWECRGVGGAPGWECTVRNLTGARVGTTMTLDLETLQSGQKRVESLKCGPITESFEASCTDRTVGLNFHGANVVERFTLRSGEVWEVKSRGSCRPPKSPGELC